jgi:hypothetical protein
VLVPRLSFAPVGEIGMDPVALAGTTIDAFDLVLVGRVFPPIEGLRKLNGRLERLRPAVNVFYADGELVWALHPIEGWTVRSTPDAPELFAALSCTGRLRGKLGVAEAVEVERGFPELDTLRRRAVSLLAMFRERAVFRMPMRAFCAVFWEAGRATLMGHSKKDETIEVPVSSEQVVHRLAQLTPDCAPTLRQIHQEYVKEAHGRTSEAHRYTCWAASYARKLEKILSAPNDARADSLGPARTELTVSVLIVTRNRAGLLRRALESLTGQERQAEEVVVVDNASTDSTAATVQAFADRLPLKFVRESKIGIPFARNTGLQNCTQDVVAFMDDDCVADPAWLREMEIPFLKDPNVGAVGGSVLPIEGQPELVSRFYESRMDPLSMEEGTDVS